MPADVLVAGPCDMPGVNLSGPCAMTRVMGGVAENVAAGAVRELAGAVVGAVTEVLGAVLDFVTTPVRPDLASPWLSAKFDRMVGVPGCSRSCCSCSASPVRRCAGHWPG